MALRPSNGLVREKRKVLLRHLTSKFGQLPSTVVSRIQGVDSLEWLDTYLDRASYAKSLDEMHWELPAEPRSPFLEMPPGPEFKEAREFHRRCSDSIREEGRKQGYDEGMRETKLSVLIQQIHNKFGPIPEDARARLEAAQFHEGLTAYLDRVPTACSLEELLRPLPEEDHEVTWEDELREEGRQLGRRAGELAAKREVLRRQLILSFRFLPGEVIARIQSLSEDDLDYHLDRMHNATLLRELELFR